MASKELREFVGAMKNIQKGIFITSSSFTQSALKYSVEQQQKSLKLIDGNMLTDLMIQYELGVDVVDTIHMYKINKDYFME